MFKLAEGQEALYLEDTVGRLWEMTRPDKYIAPLYYGMELDKNLVNRSEKR
jgi:hypothetical protein